MREPFDRVLATGGEAGALIARIDWSQHALGPISGWPQSLKTALSICLASRTPILVWWGPELYEFYNDAYRPVLGATKHPRAMGARGVEIWPEIWHIMLPIFESILAGGPAIGHEDMFMFLDRNGYEEETFFNHAHCAVLGERGEIAGIFTTVTETTDKVRGERRLIALRTLAERAASAPDVPEVCARSVAALQKDVADVPYCLICLFDGDSERLVANAGLRALSAESLEPVRAVCAQVRQRRKPAVFDVVLPIDWDEQSRSEQRQEPRQALALPLVGAEGDAVEAVLIAGLSPHLAFDERYRDFLTLAAGQISASLATAQRFEAQQRRLTALEELDRAKTHFFNNISHEFRTPLTLMLGPTEEALASPARALSGESLEAVHRNTLRLLRLVNMLLDFARLEAGRLTPRFAEHDLARLTTEHASAFQSAFERAGVTLAIDCQPLPGAVWLDEELWEKIVLNLLSNALKFTFAGEVRLTLRAVDGSAELQVSDTGTGIPAHELPAIFQRFHRVAGARARSHEGTGIGLALSHDLVRLQGGTIAVASELGRGSVFTVRLPIGNEHLSPQQLSAATEESLSAAGPSSEARHFRAGMRAAARMVPQPSAAATGHLPQILIVEDNADMRDYLVRVLAPQFELTVADNGRRALELTRELESPPDLVLSDVMMPELDGFELLRELRGTAASSSIPVLLLSARAGDDARVEGLQAGADDYLVKPFSARELIARVSAQVALGRARRDARRVQEGLRAIFQQAPVAVSVVRGPDFTFELANPRYEQMVARAGLVGRKFREAFPELPDDAPVLAMLEAVRQSGDTFAASEYPVPLDLRGEGNVQDTFFMFSCQPLTEPTPGDAILTVAIDVTEQVNMRRELETLSKEREWLLSQEQNARAGAEAANRVKDEFLAMLGHELRNPLAPIATALALLRQRGPLSKEQVIIERQVGHLTRLVEDLLDVSRITRGKVELRREPVNIAHAVQRAVELASPLLEQRRHHLQLVVPESGLEVFGDPTRLAQAVANLLSNAAKYTDPGGRIEVRAGPLSEVDVVEIAVIDNGIGIDPAMLDHIFDAFAQASQAIDRSNGGLGLGLTIVRNLIELHGGSVAARSGGKGRGSEFTLRLPRYHRMPGDATAPVDTPEAPPSRLFQRMRVLVVDDNEDAAQLLADWFLRRGAVVSVAHDGLTALAIAEHMTPQLGIIDLGLPALSGYDVARRLRANHTAEPLLLVAVTGYGQVSDREQSADAGFEAHCVKPVDLGEFEQLLGRLLLRS